MSQASIKPVLYTNKKYADGTSPILIRITIDRKSNYVKTGYSVLPSNWNPSDHRVYESKPRVTLKLREQYTPEMLKKLEKEFKKAEVLSNAAKINSAIDDKLHELQDIQRKMEVNDEIITSRVIKDKLDKKRTIAIEGDIFSHAETVIARLKDTGKAGTMKGYKTIMARYHPATLRFDDINHTFLASYEVYLRKKDYKTNYIHNNLKTIKALYRLAIQEGLASAQNNPFFTYKLKIDSNIKKEKLSIEEMDRIRALDLEPQSKLRHTRNLFLFSFYMAGIRVSDLIQLKWENIADNRIEYSMDKTGGLKSIQIRKEIAEILVQYKNDDTEPNDYIFPMFERDIDYSNPFFLKSQISSKTAIYNKNLKDLAKLANIDKKITTHIARHTFADFARKKGAAVYDVSKALGHSSIKITESYLAKFDYDTQDVTLDKIFNS